MNDSSALVLGTLTSIWRYPTKSLRREPLQSVHVEKSGLAGDRRSALVLTTPDRARTGKTYRGKEDERFHLIGDAQGAKAAAFERGMEVVETSGRRFFDDAPVSLLLDRWVHDLEGLAGRSLDPPRFRPNFFVTAAEDVPDEASLVGATVALGDVVLRVRSTTERCVTVTYDVETGTPDPAILRVLAQQRGAVMGVYCDVERPGSVKRGVTVRAVLPGRVSA